MAFDMCRTPVWSKHRKSICIERRCPNSFECRHAPLSDLYYHHENRPFQPSLIYVGYHSRYSRRHGFGRCACVPPIAAHSYYTPITVSGTSEQERLLRWWRVTYLTCDTHLTISVYTKTYQLNYLPFSGFCTGACYVVIQHLSRSIVTIFGLGIILGGIIQVIPDRRYVQSYPNRAQERHMKKPSAINEKIVLSSVGIRDMEPVYHYAQGCGVSDHKKGVTVLVSSGMP